MTQLDHSKLKIGVQPYYGYQVFSCNNHTITTGSDGDNALVPLPSGSSFFVYLTRKVKPGIRRCYLFRRCHRVQPELAGGPVRGTLAGHFPSGQSQLLYQLELEVQAMTLRDRRWREE